MKPLSECTILITGATDGLGKMIAERFAAKGARVLLHGRNREKGREVLESIKRSTNNYNLEYYNADFSSLVSVSQLAEEIKADHEQLDILINNAAIGGGPKSAASRELSQDGFELRFAVNYLAQVLLTRKLLPTITKKESRIVNVASVGQSELDFDDVMLEQRYDGYLAYSRSKLALIMFTFDLSLQLDEKGINVNALHPATLMNTNMVFNHFGRTMTTIEQGCDALEVLSSSEKLDGVTGEYFDGIEVSKALSQAYDSTARRKLTKMTEELLTPFLNELF